jgi:hypothetical protein
VATTTLKQPMTAPDWISVYHRLRTEPEKTDTALSLDCVILSHTHRRVAARTFEEVSIYDYRVAKPTTLPPFMLATLRDLWRRQEEQAIRAKARIWQLLGEVRSLEKETWDREDAVEDMGVAKA